MIQQYRYRHALRFYLITLRDRPLQKVLALPFLFACRIALFHSTLKTSKLFSVSSGFFPLTLHRNICHWEDTRTLRQQDHPQHPKILHPSSFLKTLQHLDSTRVENAQAQAKGRTKIFGHGSKFSGKIGPPGPIFPENFVPRTKIFWRT